jgi:SAM-dependent methyltransferase
MKISAHNQLKGIVENSALVDAGMLEQVRAFDWRGAWIVHNKARKAPDCVALWNERAKEFSRKAGGSPYAGMFIDSLGLEPCQRVLDMGSGGGTLAIPLARAGHKVFAADFSPRMLEVLEHSAQQEGLDNIRTALLDFNAPWEAWEAAGIAEGCVDIALASRSTMVDDLGEAFAKLERAARTKVAVTMATEFSPRAEQSREEGAEDGVRRAAPALPDYIFAVNLLFQMRRYPELRFIDSYKTSDAGQPQLIRWAFIAWSPCCVG